MNWYERILASWPLRWIVTFMITFFWSGLLMIHWSLAIDFCLLIVGAVITFNLREYISDARAGISTKHDFAGWLLLTIAVTGMLSAVMNALFKLGRL